MEVHPPDHAIRHVAVASLSSAEWEQLANSFAVNVTEAEELRDLLNSSDQIYCKPQERA